MKKILLILFLSGCCAETPYHHFRVNKQVYTCRKSYTTLTCGVRLECVDGVTIYCATNVEDFGEVKKGR